MMSVTETPAKADDRGPTDDRTSKSAAPFHSGSVRRELRTYRDFANYLVRLRKTLTSAAVVAAGTGALLWWINWVGTTTPQSKVQLLVTHLSSGVVLGAFGLLTTVALALQVAVRTPEAGRTRSSADIARRRVLAALAQLCAAASLGLGLIVAAQHFVGMPSSIDLVGIFGPLLWATLVGMIAVDAGSIMSDRERELSALVATRVARMGRALVALALHRSTRKASHLTIAGTIILAVVAPIVEGAGYSLLFPQLLRFPSPATGSLIFGALAVIAYIGIAIASYMAIRRNWLGLVGAALGSTLLLAYLVLEIAIGAARHSTGAGVGSVFATLAYTFAAVVALLAVGVLLSVPRHQRGRGPVLELILRRLDRGAKEPQGTKLPWNRAAVVSVWLSPLCPFGLIAACLAKGQLAVANARGETQRGEKLLPIAYWLSWFFPVAAAAALVLGSALSPSLR